MLEIRKLKFTKRTNGIKSEFGKAQLHQVKLPAVSRASLTFLKK
jgi:hypothetical protein